MIDWVSCRIPVTLPAPIAGGHTVTLDRAGNVERTTPHRLRVAGSFESSLAIRAPSTTELEITGNPVKWLQGHNLYGPDDLRALLWAVLERLEPHLGCSLPDAGLASPDDLSRAVLTRVDCTMMLHLDTPLDVLSWIRSAYATGSARRRGRGVMKEGTLVYGDATGKNFARWQIVIYSKGQEVADHHLPALMMADAEVLNWVNRCLRVEVRLGRLELEKQGLRNLSGWTPVAAGKMWSEKVSSLSFNDQVSTDEIDLEKLPQHLRGTYAQWKLGADLRKMLTKPMFYRHRAAIMELTRVDVAVPPASASLATAKIVPIKRALEAVPAGRPAWADRIDRELRAAGAHVLSSAA